MKLISVQSSNIAQVGLDEGRVLSLNQKPTNVLRIVFTNGLIYDYFNVEKQLFLDLLHSNSKGKFLHKHIVGQYNYERVK